MIELLERQKRLTANQWKLICTANLADLLDFFDFFLIGYVAAALTKQWSLTYWEGGAILLASGLGAPPGAFFWGWLGDRIGRRTVFIMSAITISLATGAMVFTPGQNALVPGWLFLMIFVSLSAILGRFFITTLIEPLGRRGSATLCMVCGGILMLLQGYLYDVYIGGASLFYILFVVQTFFGSANYTIVGPYMAEIWPARLRASGMGLSYGVGNLGKFIGPLGLALIMGAGDVIKPAAPNLVMLGPAFAYFASWYVLGLIGFWVFGFETKGRTFDEIDSVHDAREASPSRLPAQAT